MYLKEFILIQIQLCQTIEKNYRYIGIRLRAVTSNILETTTDYIFKFQKRSPGNAIRMVNHKF